MTDLISKLSKIDQRNVKLAIIHANNGNYRRHRLYGSLS